jgi:uncharacterized protein YcaQ
MLKNIDIDIARRFILGKQGLWPGRRWQGIDGAAQAMREMEYLQLDPLQVVARSHDIELYSRVLDYETGGWEQVTYQQRKFFDWDGWLATRPMDELPYWRVIMHRERDGDPDCDPRIRKMGHEHAGAIEELRTILNERGPVSHRDFEASQRTRTQSYRGRKDSSLALYYLWRTGEVMTHHREDFERVYTLTETVAPEDLIHDGNDAEADRFLIKKEIGFSGLSRLNRTQDAFHRGVPFSRAKQIREAMLADGDIVEVKVDGWKPVYYALASDVELLNDLSAGGVPKAWAPLAMTTSARGRAKVVFDFDYVWEVYKPKDQRKFGYYTMPMLWGDRLVARFDSKLDRTTNAFVILGLWLEDEALGQDQAFAEALTRGVVRFATFLGAARVDVQAINEPLLRRHISSTR